MAETLFQCDDALWRRFTELCLVRDETPGAVLRDLLRLEVKRHDARKARSDEVIDEQLLVRLRLLVAEALARSESWGQLQAALGGHGLRFRPSGGGLILDDLATGEALAKSSQVGPPYLDLVRRFRSGFPGHPRPGLAAQALARA
jgi:hypothetical protein